MRFEQFLIRNAAAYGTKTALVTDRTRLSYDELDDLSSRLAAALAASGVNANDRVLVFMDNCWEAAVAIFAILKAGATFSPVNASTKADKLAYIITDCEAAAILTQAKLMPIVAEARALSSAKPLSSLRPRRRAAARRKARPLSRRAWRPSRCSSCTAASTSILPC